MDETELCIIIGNLFDNAIEAVKGLPDEQRQIDFSIQNPNGIFRIEITNPYEGERRKVEHHYLTTKKENTEMHGLGLMSVQKIVEKYDGLIEINDVDSLFKVDVTFYDEEVWVNARTWIDKIYIRGTKNILKNYNKNVKESESDDITGHMGGSYTLLCC